MSGSFRRLMALIIFTPLGVVFSLWVHAADPAPSRLELFQRAHQSLAFILQVAAENDRFVQSLSAEEKAVLSQLILISQSARTSQWILENQIPLSPQNQAYSVRLGNYYDDPEQAYAIDTRVRIELNFSNDNRLFQIPNESEIRTAVTTASLQDPIHVNLNIINSPFNRLSFSDVVQLLVHEFGRKLDSANKMPAVDSIGAKVKTYLDQNTASFQTSKGRVQVVQLANSLYDDWHEATLQGTYVGVNIPPKRTPFRAISEEGFYIFFENSNGIHDMTPELHQDLIQSTRFEPYRGMNAYLWKNLHFFNPSAINVREVELGTLRLEVEVTQAQTALPFLQDGDPHPAQFKPFDRFRGQSEFGQYDYQRFEWFFRINGEKPEKLSMWQKPLLFDATQPEAKFIDEAWENNDLVLRYRIPKIIEIRETPRGAVKAYLNLRLDQSIIEVEGQRSLVDEEIVSFRLKDAKSNIQGLLSVLHVEVAAQQRNLAIPHYVRTKLFLDQSRSWNLSAERHIHPAELIEIEHVSPSRLRLRFRSQTSLNSLSLLLEYERNQQVTSKQISHEHGTQILGQGTRVLPRIISLLPISLLNAEQQSDGNLVSIIVDLNQQALTFDRQADDITPTDLPHGIARRLGLKMIEEREISLTSQIKVVGVEATNTSGRMQRRRVNASLPMAQKIRCDQVL